MQEFSDKTAPYQIPFEAFGLDLRICTNSPELLERIEPLMPPGWIRRPRSATQHRLGLLSEDNDIYSIYSEHVCTHDAPGQEYALMMMEAQIQAHVSLEASQFVFVHAGSVVAGDRAILIPGFSFSGKTTLVHALVRAGATYYSDEFAVLDESGLLHPYARPLSYRPPDGSAPVELRVEQLGGIAGTEPRPVGLVIATRYRPGAEWKPGEMSTGSGVLALLEHTVPAQVRPEQAMRVLKKAVSGAMVLEGPRGDADELAAILLETLAATA